VPIGGSDDTPSGPPGKRGTKGAVAAGVIVPLLLVGAAAAFVKYTKGGGNFMSMGGAAGNTGLSQGFMSTSTYEPDADGTQFSTTQAGGAASL
jgi:hypothetical protein